MSKGFNRHKQGLEVTGGIPKFLRGLVDEKGRPLNNVNLYARAAAAKQSEQSAGDDLDALLQGATQWQAEKNAASSTAVPQRTKRPQQQRTADEVQDELDAIVNLDEFSAEEKQAIMEQLGVKRVEDLTVIANVANQQQSTDAEKVQPAAIEVVGKQRQRQSDDATDALESETGKHLYRAAVKRTAKAATDKPSQQHNGSRQKKQKKSTLSFADDEDGD